MNETIRTINQRSSCRSFSNRLIPDDIMTQLYRAAVNAPTSGDLQAISIIEIREKEAKTFLCERSLNQKFIEKAPLCLLFCIDWSRTARMCALDPAPTGFETDCFIHEMSLIEIGSTAQNVVIAAESVGLKSVYIGNILYYTDEITEYFQLPRYVVPAILLCLGYPSHENSPHAKFPPELIVHKDFYRESDDDALRRAFESRYNHVRVKAVNRMLDCYEKTCRRLYEPDKAEKLIEYAKEKGHFGINQYEFGVFPAFFSNPMNNEEYIEYLKKQGFFYF